MGSFCDSIVLLYERNDGNTIVLKLVFYPSRALTASKHSPLVLNRIDSFAATEWKPFRSCIVSEAEGHSEKIKRERIGQKGKSKKGELIELPLSLTYL